jgi:hypothetical protein
MKGCFKYGKELSGSIKVENFFIGQVTVTSSRMLLLYSFIYLVTTSTITTNNNNNSDSLKCWNCRMQRVIG